MDFLVLVEEGKSYVVLLPIFTGLLLGERLIHELTSARKWDDRDGMANIAITIAYLVLDVLIGWLVPMVALAVIYEKAAMFEIGMGWAGWAAAFLLYDFTWYVDHPIGHRVSLFWSLHQVHHSSNEFNMTVASRGFVFDNTLITRPLFYLLPIFGVSPLHYMVVKIVTSIWGIARHTRLVPRLRPLEWVFATPSNHRVHHGSDSKYIDKNYGEILIIWDRLFGTYQAEEEEPTYGLVEPLRSYNPFRIEFAGIRWLFRRVTSASSKLQGAWALISPPEAAVRPNSER